MPNITFRISGTMHSAMKKSNVNWTEKVRAAIRESLGEPYVPTNAAKAVNEIVQKNSIPHLYALNLRMELLKPDMVLRNLNHVFPEKESDVLSDLDEILGKYDLKPNLMGAASDGTPINWVVRDAMIDSGAFDALEEWTIKNMEKKRVIDYRLSDAFWLLRQYTEGIRNFPQHVTIDQVGFDYTLEKLTKSDKMSLDLRSIGLIYYDLFYSNAYTYDYYGVPGYVEPLLRRSETETYDSAQEERILAAARNDSGLRSLIQWVVNDGYDMQASLNREELRSETGKVCIPKTEEPLEPALSKGIEAKALIVGFRPYRRRAGKRSSSPASYYVRLTGVVRRLLASKGSPDQWK